MGLPTGASRQKNSETWLNHTSLLILIKLGCSFAFGTFQQAAIADIP
jgi:hypothetical protein